MKIIDKINAQINSVNVLSNSRALPAIVVVYAAGIFISAVAVRSA